MLVVIGWVLFRIEDAWAIGVFWQELNIAISAATSCQA
jgi:hypothetical protein